MLKRIIKISAFVVSLFALILSMQYVSALQQQTPFNTDSKFDLNLSESKIEKKELIKKLNNLSQKHQVTLLKISVDVNEYKNKKDIIVFGDGIKTPRNPVLVNDEIKWLDNNFRGNLIHSDSINDRLLSGTYAFSDNKEFRSDLEKFGNKNNIQIKFVEKTPALKFLSVLFILNGFGNAVLVSFLLLIGTIMIWFVAHSKARVIRYLEGHTKFEITVSDTFEVMKSSFTGAFVSFIVLFLWLFITKRIEQIPLMTFPFLQSLIKLLLFITVFTFVLSTIVSPKAEHISKREIPLKRFMKLCQVNQFAAVFIALIVIPTTINAALTTYKLSKDYSLWSNTNMIRLSFKELDPLVEGDMLNKTDTFFKTLAHDKNLSVSLVLDKSINLSKEKLGVYDHIIITDKAWLKNMRIGIEKKGKNGIVNKINYEDIHEKLKMFLDAQLPLFTRKKEVKPPGLEFYSFKGEVFLALPPNVGVGAETVHARNPLIILADDPVKLFETDGFTLNSASSGNVVFHDMDKLKSVIQKSDIKPYISSIDNVSEVALSSAQKFKQQSVAYTFACFIIGIVIIFSGMLNGKLWAVSNKRRIFTLHTFGKTYKEIIASVLKKEAIIGSTAIIFVALFAYYILLISALILSGVVVIITVLQIVGKSFSYRHFSKQAFEEMIHRN